MQTALFDFHLPNDRIALTPANPRDSSRMLVVEGQSLTDSGVSQLPDYLKPGDVVIVNNSRVLPARLRGRRGQVGVEFLLHKAIKDAQWRAFAKPAKRLKIGDTVVFSDHFSAKIDQKLASGEVLLSFDCSAAQLLAQLQIHGEMPLPPYIEKVRATDAADSERYQTVYADADKTGSVAAPTAGLHFTPALLNAIKYKGTNVLEVTLHVGGGTFLPVKTEDTDQHVMHSEYAELTDETAKAINDAKRKGGRVIVIGTTALRTLESATNDQGITHAFSGETDIFITPGYRFKCVDVLLTNFHLPRSTLFMLVSAFSGLEQMQAAYQHAIDYQYRFYSYGDACLLFKNSN